MKLIFLDIDGVLNYEGYERFTRMGTRFVDPVLIKRLKKIIDRTGAKVVLSSTWRRGIYDMREGLTNGCTALKDIAIPPKVEQLDELTFYGCTALKRIYVSEKLSYLKKSAFMNCPSLKEIIFY